MPSSKRQKDEKSQNCIEAAVALSNDDFISSFLPSTEWQKHTTTSLFPRHLRLSLIPSAQLSKKDLMSCFDLIAESSKSHYESSILGWHPHKKRKEMRLLDLKYLLIRRPPFMRPSLCRSASSSSNDLTAALNATEKIDIGPQGEILGFVSFMPTHEYELSCLYIYEIHLSPELRGCGLGSHVIHMVEGIAEKVGVEKVMLTCFVRNKGARRFYEKLGYGVLDVVEGRKLRGKGTKGDDESGYMIMGKDIVNGVRDGDRREVVADDKAEHADDIVEDGNGGPERASKRIKR